MKNIQSNIRLEKIRRKSQCSDTRERTQHFKWHYRTVATLPTCVLSMVMMYKNWSKRKRSEVMHIYTYTHTLCAHT